MRDALRGGDAEDELIYVSEYISSVSLLYCLPPILR
jgi:hypothetical protein